MIPLKLSPSFSIGITSYLTKIHAAQGEILSYTRHLRFQPSALSFSEALKLFLICLCKQNRKEVTFSVDSVNTEAL